MIQIQDVTSKSSFAKRLLEVTNDNKLSFDIYVKYSSRKASRKLNALARLENYIDLFEDVYL